MFQLSKATEHRKCILYCWCKFILHVHDQISNNIYKFLHNLRICLLKKAQAWVGTSCFGMILDDSVSARVLGSVSRCLCSTFWGARSVFGASVFLLVVVSFSLLQVYSWVLHCQLVVFFSLHGLLWIKLSLKKKTIYPIPFIVRKLLYENVCIF